MLSPWPVSVLLFGSNPFKFRPIEADETIFLGADDAEKCIGSGHCVKPCKLENDVPDEPFYFRTWVERYHVDPLDMDHRKVDSPQGGIDMVKTRLFVSQIVLQIVLGTLVPHRLAGRDAAGAPGAARTRERLPDRGRVDAHRCLRDALDRGDRRTALLRGVGRAGSRV